MLSLERLEEEAKRLASWYVLAPDPTRRTRPVLPRLHGNARFLRDAYQLLLDDVRAGRFLFEAAYLKHLSIERQMEIVAVCQGSHRGDLKGQNSNPDSRQRGGRRDFRAARRGL